MTCVYEVEFEPFAPGQRFCRHVVADTPEDAIAIALQRQGTGTVLEVRVHREIQPGERPRAPIVGGLPQAIVNAQGGIA